MRKKAFIISCLWAVVCGWTACKNDTSSTGVAILDEDDAIIVLADTFSLVSGIDSCAAIISQPDSFLLGEIETDYGLVRAAVLTQLACPEGYSYPENAVIDSVCLLMAYGSWVGDGYSPLALDVYEMDRGTFQYARTYQTDIAIDAYCSREKEVLHHHRIVVATEKLDSVKGSNNEYVPMLRMRLNDDFVESFGAIRSFETQEQFNQVFKGLLLETSFGSSTVLNITDIALGVYYHFSYLKAGNDTTVNDLKVFYANSEVRTVNAIEYRDRELWLASLQCDSDIYNYSIAPAGVYTRIAFPMKEMVDTIYRNMVIDTLPEYDMLYVKRPYVNLAQLQVDVMNKFSGSSADITRNDWLQPAGYMLLIKEESMDRFFKNKELPTDTCALLSALKQNVDSTGNTIYYYSYDLEDFLTNQLRQDSLDDVLKMMLVPVTVTTSSGSTTVTGVRQQQTMSATQIRSAKNGMNLKIVYSGF